jgi:hypothetical protein
MNGLTDADEAYSDIRDDLIAEFLGDIEAGKMHRPTHSSAHDYVAGIKVPRAMTVGEMVADITSGVSSQKLLYEMFALIGALAAGPTGTDHHVRAKAVLSSLGEAYGRRISDYAAEVAADKS